MTEHDLIDRVSFSMFASSFTFLLFKEEFFLLEFFRFLDLVEFIALEAFAFNSLSYNFSLILFKSF